MGRLPRNYAPIDTDLFHDSKIHPLSAAAKLLFVASLLYCNKEKTDGALRHSDLSYLAGLVKVKRSCHTELLTGALWLETSTGFEIAGFLDHNKSRVEREKAAAVAKARYDDWLKRHSNGVGNAFPFPPENRDTENREAEQQQIAAVA